MTGDPARMFFQSKDKKGWTRDDIVNKANEKDRRDFSFVEKGEFITNDAMFRILLEYHRQRSVLCASGSSGKDGLHKGHAYSILDVVEVNSGPMGIGGTTFWLVKIRNPWGAGEWKGDWGDKSELWKKHPRVKEVCKFADADDGAFWMCWDDYVENWSKIGVVHRTVDIHSVKLHVRDDTYCAPTAGCFSGCCSYWCCFVGCSRLYCPRRPTDDTVRGRKGCLRWCCGPCCCGSGDEGYRASKVSPSSIGKPGA
mmetsp:Transcript_22048/g.50271  ORF Transcript_22048/g.50271 Transcript_22048/m.50271 type:complete len:254 (+) Transcript_22048:1-762(+)